MGMFCLYRCDRCGWEVSTWGPREFFRDATGSRQAYGHPSAVSTEAAQRGIAGLDAQRYCIACGKTCVVTLTEFLSPVHDPLQAWSDDSHALHTHDDLPPPTCPACGNEDLVAALPEDPPLPCPRCGQGVLVLAGGGVS